jgi:hypothetical protein
MTIEQAIYSYLSGEAGITDIVGTRIYPIFLPQDTDYPALTYIRISGPEHHDIDVSYPRFQISCWAKSYAEAKGLADEVKAAFQRFKGVMGGAQGVEVIQGVFMNDLDLYDNETQVYHIPVDIKLIHRK